MPGNTILKTLHLRGHKRNGQKAGDHEENRKTKDDPDAVGREAVRECVYRKVHCLGEDLLTPNHTARFHDDVRRLDIAIHLAGLGDQNALAVGLNISLYPTLDRNLAVCRDVALDIFIIADQNRLLDVGESSQFREARFYRLDDVPGYLPVFTPQTARFPF